MAPLTLGTLFIRGQPPRQLQQAAGGGTDVTINGGNSNYFVLYNISSQSSGSFTFLDGNQSATLNGTGLYALSDVNIGSATNGTSSKSGTLVKTGARSFTFTCLLQTAITGTTTTTVTGSGTY